MLARGGPGEEVLGKADFYPTNVQYWHSGLRLKLRKSNYLLSLRYEICLYPPSIHQTICCRRWGIVRGAIHPCAEYSGGGCGTEIELRTDWLRRARHESPRNVGVDEQREHHGDCRSR